MHRFSQLFSSVTSRRKAFRPGLALTVALVGATAMPTTAAPIEDFESYNGSKQFSDEEALTNAGLQTIIVEGGSADPAFANIGNGGTSDQNLRLGFGGDDTFTVDHQDDFENGVSLVQERTTTSLSNSTTLSRSLEFTGQKVGFRAARGFLTGLYNGAQNVNNGTSNGAINGDQVLTYEVGWSGGGNADGSGKSALFVNVRRTGSDGNADSWDQATGWNDGAGAVTAASWDVGDTYSTQMSMDGGTITFTLENLTDATTVFTGTSELSDTRNFGSVKFLAGDLSNEDNAGGVFTVDNIAVPEPGSLGLLGVSGFVLVMKRRGAMR